MLYNTGLMPLIKDLDGRHMIVTCQFLVLYNFFLVPVSLSVTSPSIGSRGVFLADAPIRRKLILWSWIAIRRCTERLTIHWRTAPRTATSNMSQSRRVHRRRRFGSHRWGISSGRGEDGHAVRQMRRVVRWWEGWHLRRRERASEWRQHRSSLRRCSRSWGDRRSRKWCRYRVSGWHLTGCEHLLYDVRVQRSQKSGNIRLTLTWRVCSWSRCWDGRLGSQNWRRYLCW
jgi:hypothetical protein